MPLDTKSFDLDVLGCLNPQTEDFNILGHGPMMLKALNSKFRDPKTSNSNFLTFWDPSS